MTVKELIEKLKTLPSDLVVYTFLDFPLQEEDIVIRENFPLGDPANPGCKYDTVVYFK